jgi:hypothetical protein
MFESPDDKTTRIYLDITGKAAIISLPQTKSIRVLAQELQSIETKVVDVKYLNNEPAKYRFEVDISKLVRSQGVIVFSTSPVTGFFRDVGRRSRQFQPMRETTT